MKSKIFSEGGPYNIRETEQDRYSLTVPLPPGEDGRVARECPDKNCSPGYFKVKPGTGITEQVQAFCPYCRKTAEPSAFTSEEQIRYAIDVLGREAHDGINKMVAEALGIGLSGKRTLADGLIKVEMTLTTPSKPLVRAPFEDEVRRDVICPKCSLDHSVYGLATWCPDCGTDIFLTHVEAEFGVVGLMLSDIERRRALLGRRVAAKDLENCLEDTVSIFETVLRIMARRRKAENNETHQAIDEFFRRTGNAFQNVRRASEIYVQEFHAALLDNLKREDIEALVTIFEKRHPITHNLGVVDKKYLERVRSAEEEGRDVLVTKEEIMKADRLSLEVFRSIHERLFPVP